MTYVRGHWRKDGSYVRGHYRRSRGGGLVSPNGMTVLALLLLIGLLLA